MVFQQLGVVVVVVALGDREVGGWVGKQQALQERKDCWENCK